MADNEMEFPKGLIVKAPRDGAPDFVKASISIKREELIEWLQGRDGDWVNLDVKEAKSGHWYAAVNTFKPKQRDAAPETKPGANVPAGEYDDSDGLPF
jgi:hypothetical protein